jgi:hypothetical protein
VSLAIQRPSGSSYKQVKYCHSQEIQVDIHHMTQRSTLFGDVRLVLKWLHVDQDGQFSSVDPVVV